MDTTDLEEVASAISPQTKLVWLESPTNPQQQISDIRVSFKISKSHMNQNPMSPNPMSTDHVKTSHLFIDEKE